MPLTPAQNEAVIARNRELLVSAAAGSGKTRVLIERIFSLLRDDGLSVDRMLIVTFTHAAAAEMRERLQARLSEAAVSDRRMRRQAELLETAQISTLHSFCQKLVREYFQAVDIDPLSALGDEAVCAGLRAAAKTDALDALYERAAAGDESARELTVKFEDDRIDRMLDDLYPFLMALPDPFDWLDRCAGKRYAEDDLLSGEMAETLLADCRILLSGAQDLAERSLRLGDDPLCPPAYRPVMAADRQAVEELAAAFSGGLPAVIAAAQVFSLGRLPAVRGLEGPEAALKERYQENRESIKKIIRKDVAGHLPEEPAAAVARLNAMQPSLTALARTARDMDERYAGKKRERNLLDFHDLERMALRILRVPENREEVAARFDGIFVDEYQDISGVQEAILNALKRDVSRETSGPPQRVFYVGDVKQSIYRFRQADPTLFMEKARAFSPEKEAPRRRISLNANFRSDENVLAAVNRVFERVMRADVTEIDYDAEARLYPGAPGKAGLPVSLHLFTQPVKAAERTKVQAYALGREILKRVGRRTVVREDGETEPLRFRDIAVLGPKMKGVSDVLERTLGELGVPVYSEDRGSGMESEEIAQTMNHLRLMDNLADDLSLLGWLRGPAVGMDERELAAVRLNRPEGSYLDALRAAALENGAWGKRCADALKTLEHERFLLAETPLDEYLWGWLGRSGLYAFYGCQPGGKLRQANLRMLCQKAGDHVRQRGGGLRDFLDGVAAQAGVRGGDSPTVLGPREDVVRVMTIHKAKGLEFPVVFVMGLEEPFARRRASALSMHPRLGVALPYVNEEARVTDDTLLKGAIDLRAQAEERAERARLLYVAMTRAKDELILMGSDDKRTPETFAESALRSDGGSGYDVSGAGSMFSWVCQCVNGDDAAEEWKPEEVLDISTRTNGFGPAFSTQTTIHPHKWPDWRLVFHSGVEEAQTALACARGDTALSALEARTGRLRALTEALRASALAAPPPEKDTAVYADPVAPPLSFTHHPFKVGVTALAYAEREERRAAPAGLQADGDDAAQAENEEKKRLPLPLARPRLMDDLPAFPAFLRPPAGRTGLLRGMATHKALSLLAYDGLRAAAGDAALLAREVSRQLNALAARRQLTPEEQALTDADTVAKFFASSYGRGALAAATVRREWSFNLVLPERGGMIAQGIIDLCYRTDGAWTLVDYKTDGVRAAEELWPLYGGQIALYRRALAEATGVPVAEAALFSLALGEGTAR